MIEKSRLAKNLPTWPKLVIFDFDGTLAETEVIFARIISAKLALYGIDFSPDAISTAECGAADGDDRSLIKRLIGIDQEARLMEEVRSEVRSTVSAGLSPTPGALEVLRSLPVSFCVASNASRRDLIQRMRAANLFGLIGPHFFSSDDVGVRKPDPALFSLAAEAMGVSSDECLVVEDSVIGLEAARRARMRCCAFTGGLHHSIELRGILRAFNPDALIDDYNLLNQLLTHGTLLPASENVLNV